MQQNEAFNLMKMGKNIFLTGAPGSGKTYLLNKYIRYLKDYQVKIAVTASTGIAATHLNGVTIHSWSGIGVRNSLNESDLEKILTTRLIKRNYEGTKTLIIDEISMLHPYQLDMIDTVSRYMLEADKPFGGLQVILCGDFFQLPPVSSLPLGNERQFAFEADAWKKSNFHICYLKEQHRQGNDPLLAVLKEIRSGIAGEQTKVPLRTRYKKEPEGTIKVTKLYARNLNVDDINERELNHLRGDEKIFTMAATGFSTLVNGLKKGCLAPEQLKLKVGAEVMFIKNEAKGQYVNGTQGRVIGFDQDEGWPVVKTYHHKTIVAYPEEWKFEDEGVVRATITQVPLRLAWAITIHKSQGMTLDAAEMDLGDVFELGMGYVALSRVRSLSGLKLMNLNELALKVHPKILDCDKMFKENSDALVQSLQTLSHKEIERCQRKTLIERFEGFINEKINAKKINKKRKLKKTNSIPAYLMTLKMLKENLSIDLIAKERGISVDTVINHIEKLQRLKQIDNVQMAYLKQTIPETDFDIIGSALKGSEDGRLKPIHEKFEGKYSYTDIKMVRLFINNRYSKSDDVGII